MYNELEDIDYTLEDAIDAIYGGANPYGGIPAEHKNPITDMFEVSNICQKYVELRHLYNDTVFYPVEIPMVILRSLCIGEVFLMTISIKNGCWGVSYMSPPYETIEIEESSLAE